MGRKKILVPGYSFFFGGVSPEERGGGGVRKKFAPNVFHPPPPARCRKGVQPSPCPFPWLRRRPRRLPPATGNGRVCATLRWRAKNGVPRQMQGKKRSSVTCHGRLSLQRKRQRIDESSPLHLRSYDCILVGTGQLGVPPGTRQDFMTSHSSSPPRPPPPPGGGASFVQLSRSSAALEPTFRRFAEERHEAQGATSHRTFCTIHGLKPPNTDLWAWAMADCVVAAHSEAERQVMGSMVGAALPQPTSTRSPGPAKKKSCIR